MNNLEWNFHIVNWHLDENHAEKWEYWEKQFPNFLFSIGHRLDLPNGCFVCSIIGSDRDNEVDLVKGFCPSFEEAETMLKRFATELAEELLLLLS